MVKKQQGFDEYGRIEPEDKRFKAIYPQQRLEAKVLHKRFTSEKSNSRRVQILADDVGLGKTRVAMIVLFAMLQKPNSHALVIAPTRMLATNWINELLNYRKKCLEPQFASKTSIEIVTSSTSLKQRLADIQENTTRIKSLNKLVASAIEHAPLGFLAFCLREYFEATGITRKNSESAKSMLKWIARVEAIANSEDSKFRIDNFHRFFSQNEILRFMRFLRRFAAPKYGNWLELHADAKSIEAALKRKRMGRLNNFIQSLAAQLDIERRICKAGELGIGCDTSQAGQLDTVIETCKYRRAFDAKRRQTGNDFLRLAAEAMPRLAELDSEGKAGGSFAPTDNAGDFKSLEDRLDKLMRRFMRVQPKTDQSQAPLTALDCMAWLYLNGLPKKSLAALSSPLVGYFNGLVESIKNRKKDKHLQKLFEENDCRKLMDCVRRYHAALVHNHLPDANFLSTLHSPWTLPQSGSRPKNKSLDEFLDDTVRALFVNCSPKRVPRNARVRFEAPMRFLELCRDLCRFKQIKEKTSAPCFWSREKLLHHVFVMYANDLKQTLNDDCRLSNFKPKGKPFALAVIDEAHNWRNKAKGAAEFSKNWAKLSSHMLLLTATPLQLKAEDLKKIVNTVYPEAQWPTNSPFEKLFLNCGAFSGCVLQEAAQRRNCINAAWDNLPARGCERIEHLAQSIGESAPSESKLQCWKHLAQTDEDSAEIRTLANAVIDFHAYLEKEMRSSLSEIMMKHLAQKQRVYYCGKDVERVLAGAPVPLHQHFYLTEGISNRASLFNFICMRISSLGSNADANLRPKLMLGLPSSYSAFLGSAIGSKVLEQAGRYGDLLEQMRKLTESLLVHPKVDVTVRIILRNLLEQGEKTLVFCERLKTVTEIGNVLRTRIDAFFAEHDWSNASIANRFETLAGERDKTKNLESILKELSREIFSSLFPDSIWELKNPTQENFEARILLVVSQAARALEKIGIQKVAEAAEELLEPKNSKEQELDSENHQPMKSIELITGNHQDRREAILQGFSSPALPFCLICSPVSQEGVNLHGYCREIVLHDLNWNPALLEQRIGRVDRRGSLAAARKLPVEVYVPFLSTSYDEYQYRVMVERAELQELAFGRNEFVAEEASEDEAEPAEDWSFKEHSEKRRALIGNLIYGLFDMELAVTEEDAAKLDVVKRPQDPGRSG